MYSVNQGPFIVIIKFNEGSQIYSDLLVNYFEIDFVQGS